MGKFNSPTLVYWALMKEGHTQVPTISAISRLYGKFCSFGTVLDLSHTGRPKIPDKESTDVIEEIPQP